MTALGKPLPWAGAWVEARPLSKIETLILLRLSKLVFFGKVKVDYFFKG